MNVRFGFFKTLFEYKNYYIWFYLFIEVNACRLQSWVFIISIEFQGTGVIWLSMEREFQLEFKKKVTVTVKAVVEGLG